MSQLEYSLPGKSGEAAHLKGRVAGLVISCPVTQDNPPDCPLHAVRQLPLHERYRWIGTLLPEQMKKLLDQHGACIVRKEREEREPA